MTAFDTGALATATVLALMLGGAFYADWLLRGIERARCRGARCRECGEVRR